MDKPLASNTKIEADLLDRAIAQGFEELTRDHPDLQQTPSQLGVCRAIYGHGFIAGTKYGYARVNKLVG